MAVDLGKLVAAISPDTYCKSDKRKEVKEIARTQGYLKAAGKAELVDYEFLDLARTDELSVTAAPALETPIERHTLIYDTIGDSFEPLYLWMLDKMETEFKSVDKLVDNFVSSPGSTHFAEMTNKAKQMQEEGMKMLGAVNQVLKSLLNLIYDLKEFELRLEPYEMLKSKEKERKEGAMYTLKQVWMDTVDIKRGNSSIKALALSQQGGFITLIDAFMSVDNEKLEFKGKEIDLNERVKRILQQRVSEFFVWIERSEQELRKRYEIEKNYLKSQYNTVQLYSKWAKPYLKAARALEQNMTPTAAITTVFNMAIFELALLGKQSYDPSGDITKGDMPKSFAHAKSRKYNSVVLLEIKFRSMPERTQQGGVNFRVKTEVTFTSFGLNDDEIKTFKKELEKDDMNDTLRLLEGATTDSLDQIKLDIDHFLGSDKKKEEKEKRNEEDINPFSALFSFFKPAKVEAKKEEKKDDGKSKIIAPDNDVEKIFRSQAIVEGRRKCYRVYDIYKKTKRMGSLPGYS